MRPIPKSIIAVVLVGCFVAAVALAGERECEGPYKGRALTPEELATVLRNHQAWLASGSKRADVRRANLCQADLREARLSWADLSKADLRGADLLMADLREAELWEANLQGVLLSDANLQGAFLSSTNLQGADLQGANLQGALYEPHPGKLPNFWTLTDSRNHLDTLVFHTSPAGLMALREAFKTGGMRTQERQLTYVIEHISSSRHGTPHGTTPGKRTRGRGWSS